MSNNSYSHKVVDGVKKSVHRHVMEVHLGRELGSDEHVYHVNGDSKDNRIENLVLVRKTYNKPIKPKKKNRIQILEEELRDLKSRVKKLEERDG